MIYSINGQKFDSNYLQHHGVLGQKWGVRRFQNKDGTWTKEGLARRREQFNTAEELKRAGRSKKLSENLHLRKYVTGDYNIKQISQETDDKAKVYAHKLRKYWDEAVKAEDECSSYMEIVERKARASKSDKTWGEWMDGDPKLKKLSKKMSEAWEAYDSKLIEFAKDFIGDYKDKNVQTIAERLISGKSTFGDDFPRR